MYTRVKTPAEIEAMRTSGRMLATVLQTLKPQIEPGMTAKDIDAIAARELKKLGGKAAFLNYQGFPASICVSINDEVVHGIPRAERVIQDGDIVSMDFGVNYKGMITDAAISVVAGKSNQRLNDFLKYTEQSLYDGLSVIRDGSRAGDVGYVIEKTLNKHGYGIVRELVGHGVGHDVHEDPNIPNYGRKNTGATLVSGMTIAVEPMATLGKEDIIIDADGWTVRTKDSSLSCHFEHTVLVTQDGCEILTSL